MIDEFETRTDQTDQADITGDETAVADAAVGDETPAMSPIDAAIEALRVAEQLVTAAATATANGTAPPPKREKFDMTRQRLIEPVEIVLDKPRHLKLPFWALMEFEELTGINPWSSEDVFKFPPKMKTLTTLLWCALREEDPDLTLDQVKRMPGLEFGQVYYILHCLDLCWGKNMPDPDPPKEGGRPDPNPFAAVPAG